MTAGVEPQNVVPYRLTCRRCGARLFTDVEAWMRFDGAQLTRFVRSQIRSMQIPESVVDPDDVIQETYIALEPLVNRIDNPSGWCRTVARRKIGHLLRGWHADAAGDASEVAATGAVQWSSLAPLIDDIARADASDWALCAIRYLPDQQRAAMYLTLIEQMTPAEIAQRLNIAVATVNVHIHRARARLRDWEYHETYSQQLREQTAGMRRAVPRLPGRGKAETWTWCPCSEMPPLRATDEARQRTAVASGRALAEWTRRVEVRAREGQPRSTAAPAASRL